MTTQLLTQERIKELLNYDKDTGVFTWRVSRGNKSAGSVAGCKTLKVPCKKHYVSLRIDKKLYLAHRLAWLYMTGDFPINDIDHINGDGTDNRATNIRHVTRSENGMNQRINSKNKSGVMGVHFDEKYNWRAIIKVNQKYIHLGYFDDFDEAVAARKSAEIEHGFHPNHGSVRPL